MRILVLDDQDTRHEQIRARLMGHDVTHAYLWSDFARALDGERFDVIMLDHDLGDMIEQERKPGMYGASTVYDGQDAARAVAELPEHKWPRFTLVHSWNEDGAKRMVDVLIGTMRPGVRRAMFGRPEFWRFVDAMVSR